uniref:ShKT domain-containing protein n=1 Tax=Corethron hystrix TaxID=216773 RepID=A0A7S1FKD1_9STRA
MSCLEIGSLSSCEMLLWIGFPANEISEIFINCPSTCGICKIMKPIENTNISILNRKKSPENKSLFKISPMPILTQAPTLLPSKKTSESTSSEKNTLVSLLFRSSGCTDSIDYKTPLGLRCSNHNDIPLPCESYYTVGFDDDAVLQLLLNCPRACGLCDKWIRPSLLPFLSRMEDLLISD